MKIFTNQKIFLDSDAVPYNKRQHNQLIYLIIYNTELVLAEMRLYTFQWSRFARKRVFGVSSISTQLDGKE